MRPFIVGVGRAGCKITNLFVTKGYNGILLDTEKSDLLFFPYKYKLLLGEKFLDGNGAGSNIALGREVMEAEKYNVIDRIDSIKDNFDCIFVFSGMGGGTGGTVDILIEELRKSYLEPVYYVGVLPSIEDSNQVMANFSENFKRILSNCNAFFPIDNDHLKEKMKLRGWYNKLNSQIYKHFSNLFELGEYKSREDLGENVLGATDVINTLSGISSIGVGVHELEGGFGILSSSRGGEDKPGIVVSLTGKAANNTLVPLNVKESQRAIVAVYGPRRYLDFLGSIPARLWVEKNIGGVEVRGGDIPSSDRKNLEVMILLSGIKKSERLKYLYQFSRVQKNRDVYIEKISGFYDRLKVLESKFGEIQEDFKKIYEDIKGVPEERKEDLL